MGARINFAFKDREGHAVVLYSHWGETTWQTDLANAIQHARPRWSDSAYGTRMMISYLISDQIMSELGFGIYAVTDVSCLNDSFDDVVIVDFADQTVRTNVSVDWDKFVAAYSTDLAAQPAS